MSNRAGHYVPGETIIPPPESRRQVVAHYTRRQSGVLSARELEVLTLTAQGLTQAEVGARLYLTVDTVKTHAKRTQRALGARGAAHAVAIALTRGLITLDPQET